MIVFRYHLYGFKAGNYRSILTTNWTIFIAACSVHPRSPTSITIIVLTFGTNSVFIFGYFLAYGTLIRAIFFKHASIDYLSVFERVW
jgi:hypothetical protein